jgi:hypothetical protein
MEGWFTRRDRVAVLGVRLTPLTLGHLFLLDDLDLDPDAGFTKPQLMAMVFACSQPAAEARVAMGRWWLPLVSSLWMWRTRKLDLAHEAEEFCDWFCEQRSGPETVSKSKRDADDYAAPLHMNLLAVALGKLHLTEADALAMPVRRIRQLIVALGESEGTIDPWTWHHENLRRMVQKFDERAAKQPPVDSTRN